MGERDRQPRFKLLSKSVPDQQAAFAVAVRNGLTSVAKSLPCCFFYDALGSKLFQAICELPEYYVTRAERQMLATHAVEIAACLPPTRTLVELGSGNSDKTRLLIHALLERCSHLRYVPLDLSRQTLQENAEQLAARYAELEIVALCAEYEEGLGALGQAALPPVLIAWLGSSIGNLGPHAAVDFLRKLRASMSGDDRLLVGYDLCRNRSILEPAYDDPLGVTAAFNLNLLVRINSEFAANFDLSRFKHVAKYNEPEGRIEMHIVSVCDQTVSIAELGLDVTFHRDEHIHTENSYKYTSVQIGEMLQDAGFKLDRQWLDDGGRFALSLARTVERSRPDEVHPGQSQPRLAR